MAKHVFRRADEERTELLGHDELFVQRAKAAILITTLGCMIRKSSAARVVEVMR